MKMRILRFTILTALLAIDQLSAATTNDNDSSGTVDNDLSGTNIAFDLPDLTATLETTSGLFQLEAYKSINNDPIIRDVTSGQASARTSQLFWVSVGQPAFIKTPDRRNPNITRLFHQSTTGYNTYIQMLTSAHRSVLASTARTKYRVEVTENQIVNLILSKFECFLVMFDDVGIKYLLKGKVSDFRHFPLRMNFYAPPRSTERKLFHELLEDPSDLEFMCNFASTGKLAKTNTLTISAQQQQLLGLREKLFGQASTNGPSDVYVTRDQMTDLASKMYSTLNIVEDYQIPEIQFSEAFVDGMINQIASSQFKQVPIDDVLASLSKYGFDIGEDLQPDVIKRDLGSILTIEKRDEKSRIILNESNYKNFEESRTGSGGGKAGFFGISASAKWANGNSQKDTVDIRSLSDQLRELNTLSQKDIAWDINGQIVVPKSLNVARLASSKLGRTISFSRIRIQSFLAPFDRLFAIYTNRAEAEASILDQLWARFNALQVDLRDKNKNLTDEVRSSVRMLTSSIQTLTTTVSQRHTTIDSQLQHLGSRLDSSVTSLTSSVQSVSSSAVKRCRVCFYESEGSSQCQGTRNSCSQWSDAGAGWTQAFRDDTDNRGGGCHYQWKVECQT